LNAGGNMTVQTPQDFCKMTRETLRLAMAAQQLCSGQRICVTQPAYANSRLYLS